MSPALSWVEHLVMAVAICVSLVVLIVPMFLAERSDNRRSRAREHPGGQRRDASKR